MAEADAGDLDEHLVAAGHRDVDLAELGRLAPSDELVRGHGLRGGGAHAGGHPSRSCRRLHSGCEYTSVPASSSALVGRAQPRDRGAGHFGRRAPEARGELLVAGLVVGGEAGVDVERDDSLRCELHVQLPGDAEERGLRRAVAEAPATLAGGSGRVHRRGGRRHVDDATAAALEHPRHHQLREVQLVDVVADDELGGGVEVELEDAVHAPGALVDRVVDQRVDATPPADHGVDHGVDRGTVEEVHRHRERALPASPRWRRPCSRGCPRSRAAPGLRARSRAPCGRRLRAPCAPRWRRRSLRRRARAPWPDRCRGSRR